VISPQKIDSLISLPAKIHTKRTSHQTHDRGNSTKQPPSMAGLPSNKYDLLPYSTTFESPSSTPDNFNYTHHRASKREYIESSDADDVPSSPPRKYRGRKRREWRDSSDLGYSSDIDEDIVRRTFLNTEPTHRRRTVTVAGGERIEEIMSSQASQESSTSKFQRILVNAITDGLDSLDFSYVSTRIRH
jgi:hypothetical protein